MSHSCRTTISTYIIISATTAVISRLAGKEERTMWHYRGSVSTGVRTVFSVQTPADFWRWSCSKSHKSSPWVRQAWAKIWVKVKMFFLSFVTCIHGWSTAAEFKCPWAAVRLWPQENPYLCTCQPSWFSQESPIIHGTFWVSSRGHNSPVFLPNKWKMFALCSPFRYHTLFLPLHSILLLSSLLCLLTEWERQRRNGEEVDTQTGKKQSCFLWKILIERLRIF